MGTPEASGDEWAGPASELRAVPGVAGVGVGTEASRPARDAARRFANHPFTCGNERSAFEAISEYSSFEGSSFLAKNSSRTARDSGPMRLRLGLVVCNEITRCRQHGLF
eukprot:9485895-Pyramimonas_sp.AAC.1